MNVMELIIKQYNNQDMPKNIKINKLNYSYDYIRKTYKSEYGEFMSFDFTNNVLLMPVEIIEEQQDTDIQEIEELDINEENVTKGNIIDAINDKIIWAKQIDKKMRSNQ